jgi:hypothetical protein
LSIQECKEEIEEQVEIMEKEIIYLKGWWKMKALKAYRRLVSPQLKAPIFLRRSE